MKIIIKTGLITLEVEDHHIIDANQFTKRALPTYQNCVTHAVNEAIKLHQNCD